MAGNEKADEFAKAAAEHMPDSEVPDELRWETSLSHMTRIATENRTRRVNRLITERLGHPRRKYKPPLGRVFGVNYSNELQTNRQPVLPAAFRTRSDRPLP